MVNIIDALVVDLDTEAVPREIRVGPYWTAVAVERAGELRGGLSTTMHNDAHPHVRPPVEKAGSLLGLTAEQLVGLARSSSLVEASIGMATINALLTVDEGACTEINAAEVIIREGAGKRVAVVGHFPFIPKVREAAKELWVLELRPQPGDLPAEASSEVIPQADVVAITGTSLINGTFAELMAQCRPDAYVIVLGGSAPLSPVLFRHGVNAVAGTKVVDVSAVMLAVSQAAIFRGLPGKRLLTMESGTGRP